jgi:predicted dehydrogenase
VEEPRLNAPADQLGTLTTIVDGKPKREIYPTIKAPTYVGFYSDFALALDGKREVPITAEDARDVIKIIEAANKSSNEGRSITL